MTPITALLRCLGRGPTGPDAPAELLEMKTAVAWCFASLAGTEDLAAHLYDAGAHVLFATLLVVVKDDAPLPASPDRVHTPGDIRAYLAEAMQHAQDGKRVASRPKPQGAPSWCPALQDAFDADPAFKDAMDALTPGRQREYNEHIASAKREATQHARLAKILPMVLDGKGLNDRYR